jgi:hypothetical protein
MPLHSAGALLGLHFVCFVRVAFPSFPDTHHRTRGGGRGPLGVRSRSTVSLLYQCIVISVHHSIGARFIFRLSFEKKKKKEKKEKKGKRMAVVS